MTSTPQSSELSSRFYAAVLDALPLPIFVKDDQSRFVLSNRRHAELIGHANTSPLGHTTVRLHGEQEAILSRERDVVVLESGKDAIVRRDYVYPTGQTFFLETRKSRVEDEVGKHYILGVNIDYTELRQQQAHLGAVNEAVPVGIAEFRRGIGVVYANSLTYDYLGIALPARQASW